MPKSTTTKTKPAKSNPSKPPAKRASKTAPPPPESEAGSDDASPPSTAFLDKTFVLRLVLAKLDAVKTCDWHELAQKLGAKEGDEPKGKGKKKKTDGKVWTGSELHDIYHHIVLPALRSGRALWTDDAVASDLYLPSPPASTTGSDKAKTKASLAKTTPVPVEAPVEEEEAGDEGAKHQEVEEDEEEVVALGEELGEEEDDDKTIGRTEEVEEGDEVVGDIGEGLEELEGEMAEAEADALTGAKEEEELVQGGEEDAGVEEDEREEEVVKPIVKRAEREIVQPASK